MALRRAADRSLAHWGTLGHTSLGAEGRTALSDGSEEMEELRRENERLREEVRGGGSDDSDALKRENGRLREENGQLREEVRDWAEVCMAARQLRKSIKCIA